MISAPAAELDLVQLDQRINDVLKTFNSGNAQMAAEKSMTDEVRHLASFPVWSFARTAKSLVAALPSGKDTVARCLHQSNGGNGNLCAHFLVFQCLSIFI